jgi:hypothetical protein
MRCWFIRLARTGTLAAAFWCRAALVNRGNRTLSLQRFRVSIKELAEWFGLEICPDRVDECPASRRN